MNILFIAPRFPYPTTKGDQLRVWHFLDQLKKNGHRVVFVCSAETPVSREDLAVVEKLVDKVIVGEYGKFERYVNLVKAPFKRIPFQVAYFYSKAVQRQVDRALSSTEYDVIFCQMVRTAQYLGKKTQAKTLKVLDFQDAYSLNMYKRYRSEKGLVKAIAWLEWILLKDYERRLESYFDKTIIISERDKAVIDRKDIVVLGNGVQAKEYKEKRIAYQIVFSGNLKYFPNREAVVWFTTKVFPLIQKSIPTATLQIVGATPPSDVIELAKTKGVSVVPNPPDLFIHLSRAQLAVAPMLSGSGLQNKVLEAMAVGTPVILTKHAMDGLGGNLVDILKVADVEASSMADVVVELLNSQSECIRIGQLGQNYVRQHFSWDGRGRELNDLLQA